jgi:hypothetical protein
MSHVNDHEYMKIRHMKISISIRSENEVGFAVQSQGPRHGQGTKARQQHIGLSGEIRAGLCVLPPSQSRNEYAVTRCSGGK